MATTEERMERAESAWIATSGRRGVAAVHRLQSLKERSNNH